MALEVLISESDDVVEATIFSRKGDVYVDVQFVIVARYCKDADGVADVICFQEDCGNEGRTSPIFPYYMALQDECGIKRLDAGIYRLVLPKKDVDGKVLHEFRIVGGAGIVLKSVKVAHS